MTKTDRMILLREMVAKHGQAAVARAIGRSDTAICNILKDKYDGSPDIILQLVEETYGHTVAACPILGEITLRHCAEERKKGFSTSRARLWMACKECSHNTGRRTP